MTAYYTSTGNIQEVILQEHLQKEDEVLVSLAGLKQVGLRKCSMFCHVFFVYLYHLHTSPVSPPLGFLSDQRHP